MNGRGLGRIFLNAGWEVMVISSVLNVAAAGKVREEENDDLIRIGAKIVYLPEMRGTWAKMRAGLKLVRTVRHFSPDVLLGSGLSWHLGLLGITLPSRVRKIFFEVMSGEAFGRKDPRWLVRWFFDEVIGQSPRVAATFARAFGWRKKLAAIPAFPEPLELTATLPVARRKAVPRGTARAGFFSRLVEGKQGLWLVRQWENLKDMMGALDVHGSGPEQVEIEAFIRANSIGDRVRCLGRYPSGQAYADLLATYDLTLLPTIFPEGAPLVLLESMACGVPFVANGVGGIPDYATDNPDCIVVPEQSRFLGGVRTMVEGLSRGEIDQARLQRFYLERYSNAALAREWLNYIGGKMPENSRA